MCIYTKTVLCARVFLPFVGDHTRWVSISANVKTKVDGMIFDQLLSNQQRIPPSLIVILN